MLQRHQNLDDGKQTKDETEVLLCGLSFPQKAALIAQIRVGESRMSLSASARVLGLVIDANFDMTPHINSVIKFCYCHLRSLGKLRPFLTQDAANVIPVSLIMSRLDCCNSTLWGHAPNQ